MINGLKSQIDKHWTEFWTGGITNPLMVIEQISFLMFARLLDIRETRDEKKATESSGHLNGYLPTTNSTCAGRSLKTKPRRMPC